MCNLRKKKTHKICIHNVEFARTDFSIPLETILALSDYAMVEVEKIVNFLDEMKALQSWNHNNGLASDWLTIFISELSLVESREIPPITVL